MKHTLKGEYPSRDVYLDDNYLSPNRSQKVYNHSPDGFNWGYCGSGPAQLALAICLEVFGSSEVALNSYRDLQINTIAKLPRGTNFEIEFDL